MWSWQTCLVPADHRKKAGYQAASEKGGSGGAGISPAGDPSAASRYVKPGGTLLYSTCTVDRAENEENAAWILENLPFHKKDITGSCRDPAGRLPGKPDPAPSGDPWLRWFFLAAFEKIGSRYGKKDLKSMDLNEVTAFVTELGEKPFRAKQLYQWMHQKLAPSLEDMTNLPRPFGSVFWSMERIRPWRRSRCWNPGSTGPGNTCSAWETAILSKAF